MTATDILIEEHIIIEKVLDCLQKMVVEAESKGRLDGEAAGMAVDFFKNFADGCHHSKEEDCLFQVMKQHGVPEEGGPIGVMLYEHDEGRAAVRGMADSIEKAAAGDPDSLAKFVDCAQDFIPLLRNHIYKENQILFPMADGTIAEATAESLLVDFREIERRAGGKRHADYVKLATALCDRYQIKFVDETEVKTLAREFGLDAI